MHVPRPQVSRPRWPARPPATGSGRCIRPDTCPASSAALLSATRSCSDRSPRSRIRSPRIRSRTLRPVRSSSSPRRTDAYTRASAWERSNVGAVRLCSGGMTALSVARSMATCASMTKMVIPALSHEVAWVRHFRPSPHLRICWICLVPRAPSSRQQCRRKCLGRRRSQCNRPLHWSRNAYALFVVSEDHVPCALVLLSPLHSVGGWAPARL